MKVLRKIGLQATTLALLAAPLFAQSIGMEATGTVLSNTISSGPLAGAPTGASINMSFDVSTPGFVTSPGYENYTITQSTFLFDAGGFQTGMTSGGVKIGLQNDFPVNDGVHLFTTKITSDLWMEFELWGANGVVFDSTDATQEAGIYGAPNFQAASWVIFGSGGTMEIAFANFTIHAPVVPGKLFPWNCGVNPAQSLVALSGLPAVGESFTLGIDNPLGTQASGSLPILFFSDAPDSAGQCGTLFPGFGMAGAGAAGALLIDLVAPNPLVTLYGPAWAGPGVPAPFPVTVPNLPALVGIDFYAQGVLVDPVTPGATFGVTNGMKLVIGG